MNIKQAIKDAENHKSKIPQSYFSHMQGGLASEKMWHLLNNLAAQAESYLEIGTYMGSTLMAALYDNNIKATAVDNFCMKPHTRNHFFQNTKGLNFTFIEQDCFKIDRSTIEPIDLYFFDGEHSYSSQYKALEYFLPVMKDVFVFVVDDWTNTPVKNGTMDAIRDLKLTILECEIRGDGKQKDKSGWWCGTGIFRLKKP